MEQTINIEELVQDDHNLNKGTAEGRRLMERSFKELGAGRSILVDKDGRIIAGNKSQKAAMAAGIRKVRVIETEGVPSLRSFPKSKPTTSNYSYSSE